MLVRVLVFFHFVKLSFSVGEDSGSLSKPVTQPNGVGATTPPEEAAEDSESTWRFSDDNIKHKYKSESITAENDEVEDKTVGKKLVPPPNTYIATMPKYHANKSSMPRHQMASVYLQSEQAMAASCETCGLCTNIEMAWRGT